MVWGQHAGKPSSLSYEAFLSMAEQEDLDVSDEEYAKRLYQEVLGLLQDMSAIATIDAGSTEPWGFHARSLEVE